MTRLSFKFKPKNELETGGRSAGLTQTDGNEPENKCPNCHHSIPVSILFENDNVCSCGYHFRMNARQRIGVIADKHSFHEMFEKIRSHDPIRFPDYARKLEKAGSLSKEKEAVICGICSIEGEACCIFIMEPYFMMGSMGTAVGEKITRLFEYAAEHQMNVVGYTVSGGARMQEGLFSLMQMAKISGAVKRHSDKGLFYLTVLTDPTTGGVTASFAMEGDMILAEPGAMIGFAGSRVIEQTTRKPLPKGFQTAEFLLKAGFVDAIVPRSCQKKMIAQMLRLHRESRKR